MNLTTYVQGLNYVSFSPLHSDFHVFYLVGSHQETDRFSEKSGSNSFLKHKTTMAEENRLV
jgi:hypothetical protein